MNQISHDNYNLRLSLSFNHNINEISYGKWNFF